MLYADRAKRSVVQVASDRKQRTTQGPIYKVSMDEARCGAVSQTVNSCAAHDWGQVLMFQGKIG